MTLLRIPDGAARLSLPEGQCRACGKPFIKFNSMQVICATLACARRVPVIARATLKAEKKADRAKAEALKPRSHWMKQAQTAFNSWVRVRDAHLGCVSCGTTTGKENAGHYLSTGARPELRFCETNVAKQCERCNTYLHGNLIPYRIELIRRVGQPEVDRLEGPHEAKKYSVDELKAIRDEYRSRAKLLERKRA